MTIEEKIHAVFPELASCLRQLIDRLNPIQVILFGSYAKNQERADSDLDILVILDRGFTPQATRMEAIRQARHLLKPVHRPKDVLVFSDTEVEAWKNSPNHIISEALREGWTLYER